MTAASNQPVQHYSLKSRAIAWISRTLFDWPVYRVRHGLLAGMRRRGGLAWLPMEPASTKESQFWASRTFRDKIVYDVGSFHGLLTLHFARSARRVFAYEPDAINRQRLSQNVSLNRLENVTIRPVGLSDSEGMATMQHDTLFPGGSRLIRESNGDGGVPVRTMDGEVTGGQPAPDFLKIDVEGLEIPVLQGAMTTLSQHRPEVFVEIHGNTEAEKEANAHGVIELLRKAGYTQVMHLESGQPATRENAHRGHVHAIA